MFARTVRTRDQPVEKRGGVGRVVPGESKGLVRERKRKVDPVDPAKVDFLRGKSVSRPVWVVSHYERASVGEGSRRRGRTSHAKKRRGAREKPKEDQGRHRNNKQLHIKTQKRRWTQPMQQKGREWEEEEKLNSQSGPLRHSVRFWIVICDVALWLAPSPSIFKSPFTTRRLSQARAASETGIDRKPRRWFWAFGSSSPSL